MNIDINLRQNQLTYLRNYHNEVDTEVTMILQNLQWDRKHLVERRPTVACQYDSIHRVPADKLLDHEKGCFLKCQGYMEEDRLLPSPVDASTTTLVKLNGDHISEIINNASRQPLFKTGAGCSGQQPLTLERLQATYTADERRAIHDAVVNHVPSCPDLSDLALLSSKDDISKESKTKSKLEILAELRDMRRRRTKYRVAAKTRNYSDVLRDVITTQMELYLQTNNSMNQIHMSHNNPNINSKAKDDRPNEKYASRYSINSSSKGYHSIEGHTPVSTKGVYDLSHSRAHVGYEISKRRHKDLDYVDNSIAYSQTRELEEFVPSKTDQYKDHMNNDNKSKRRDREHTDARVSRKRHKYHDHYESCSRHRGKEYDRKGKTRTDEYTYTTRDKTIDYRHDYSKLKDKYHHYERHHSYSVRQEHDHYRNKKVSPKNKDDVDRQKRYEYKRKQDQTVRIKKEKEDLFDDNSTSSDDDRTEYSDITSQNCETRFSSIRKVKVEKELNVKQEGNNLTSDHAENCEKKWSDTFNESQKSNIFYSRHINSTECKDKHKYYDNNIDRTDHDDKQQQDRRETMIQNIKMEKDIMSKAPLDTNTVSQETGVGDSRS